MCIKLTYLLTYFNQLFLKEQLELWESYPDDVLSNLDIIIIDDCSLSQKAYPLVCPYKNKMPIRLFRVLKDIKWNQPGALNLGMCVANTNWVFHADIDNVVTAKSMREIIQATQGQHKRYDFLVHVKDRTPLNPSAWLLTRDVFWDVGGYDEDFAGNYGYDDSFLRYELERAGYLPVLLKHIKIHMANVPVPDPRDVAVNKRLLHDKVMSYKFNQPKRILRFPWRRLI